MWKIAPWSETVTFLRTIQKILLFVLKFRNVKRLTEKAAAAGVGKADTGTEHTESGAQVSQLDIHALPAT